MERKLTLLPVHAAPNTVSGRAIATPRKPGRPRKVERRPDVGDLEYHAQLAEEREAFIESDPLVKATESRADTTEMLHTVKLEVAKEAAALHFQRIENEKYGRDCAQVSSRRIEALKKIADIELDVRKLGAEKIDLKSEKMQRVFSYFIQQIKEVAADSLEPEEVDLLFNRLGTALDGWEEKCEDLVSAPKSKE